MLGSSFFHLEDELAEIFGRPVDLHSRNAINKHLRDRVLRDAQLFYAAWTPPHPRDGMIDSLSPTASPLYEALDLVSTAGPMEFLARSPGRRADDCIELLPMPDVEDGQTSCVFLVRGVRYVPVATDASTTLSLASR